MTMTAYWSDWEKQRRRSVASHMDDDSNINEDEYKSNKIEYCKMVIQTKVSMINYGVVDWGDPAY